GIDAFASERADFITDEVELRPHGEVWGATTYVGHEGWERFITDWTEDFDDWTLETEELIDGGDTVVARIRQTGRGKGSGAPGEFRFGAVVRFRHGRIAQVDLYMT